MLQFVVANFKYTNVVLFPSKE